MEQLLKKIEEASDLAQLSEMCIMRHAVALRKSGIITMGDQDRIYAAHQRRFWVLWQKPKTVATVDGRGG